MTFFGRLSHPNLIKLIGYCWEDTEFLLIYEFMQNGSLENHLFGSKSLKHNWILLLSICAGNVLWMWFKCKRSFGLPYTSFIYAGGSAIRPFPWDIRLKIAIGAARGLAFLHTSDKQVIHRGFKSSDILLDGVNFYWKVNNYQTTRDAQRNDILLLSLAHWLLYHLFILFTFPTFMHTHFSLCEPTSHNW